MLWLFRRFWILKIKWKKFFGIDPYKFFVSNLDWIHEGLEGEILECNMVYDIIHVTWLQGDIPDYLPQGDRKGLLCCSMPKAEGKITLQGFPVTEGQIFWYCHPRRHVLNVKWHLKKIKISLKTYLPH